VPSFQFGCLAVKKVVGVFAFFVHRFNPDVDTESLPIINEQLKDFKEDKNLVMYCTGEFGVRKLRLILNTRF
jgi:predicted sulfurtransferase